MTELSARRGDGARLFRAGPPDALDGQGRMAGLFGDEPVLFFDHGARGSVTVESAEDFAWNPAVGSLRSIGVEHVEQIEFGARCRLPCHDLSPCSPADSDLVRKSASFGIMR